MDIPTRRRTSGACLAVGAMLASLFALTIAAPPAAAAPVEVIADCSAAGNPFQLPMTIDASSAPTSVLPGESFDVTFTPSVTLTEEWIQGALIIAPTVVGSPVTDIDVTAVRVRVPLPDGATNSIPAGGLNPPYPAGTVETSWPEGTITVGVLNTGQVPGIPAYDPLLPPSETNIPSFATGDFIFTAPAPITQTYTATGAGGTDIDFLLGAHPLRIDLNVGFPLPITCTGVATEVPDPSVDPQPDPPITIPYTQTAFLTVPIDEPPVPTANISSVTGQVVDDAARAGNVISFGGPNWSSSTAISVELCDLAATTCSASEVTGVTASIDGSGVLSGTATVDSTATTGARLLRVSTDQLESDTADLLVLGTPTISAPSNAGEGAPIQITGTNWNPNSPTTAVQFLNATGDAVLAGPFLVTVSDTGSFSTTQTVVADMGVIAAGEGGLGYPQPPGPSTPGSLWAIQPGFQVSADECTVLGSTGWSENGQASESCSIQQTVLLDVLPGALSMSQDGGIVDLGDLQLNGRAQVVPGAINEVTVVDATGALFGWDLTATMTDLTTGDGIGNRRIPAGNLEWTPGCDAIDADGDGIVDGDGGEVQSGPAGALDNTVASTLCTAPVGGGGGTFTGNASFDLLVPANVAAGDYQSTITILLM